MSRLSHTRLLVPLGLFALTFAVAEARADTGQSCSKSYAANLIAIAQKYGATKPQARLEDVGRSNAAFVECVFAERQPEMEGDLIGTGKMLTNDGQFVQVNPDGDWVLYVPAAPDTAHQRATQIDANLRSALGDGASVLPLRWDGLAIAEQRSELSRLKAAGVAAAAPSAAPVPAVSLTPNPADLDRLKLSGDLDAALADAASNAGTDANSAYQTANQQATQNWTNDTQRWVQGYVEAVIRARAQQQQEQDEEDAQQQADDQEAAQAFSAFLGGLAQGFSAAAQQQEVAQEQANAEARAAEQQRLAYQQAQITQSLSAPTYTYTPSPAPTEPTGTVGFVSPPTTTTGGLVGSGGQSGDTTPFSPGTNTGSTGTYPTTGNGSTGTYPTTNSGGSGGAIDAGGGGGGNDDNDPANYACCDGTPALPERNFDPDLGGGDNSGD